MKKKLYLSIVGISIALIALIAIFFQAISQSSSTSYPSPTPTPFPQNNVSQSHAVSSPAENVQPSFTIIDSGSQIAETIAKNFYSWYFSYPGNPLSSDAYKTYPYLSNAFIQFTALPSGAPPPSDDPVFCTKNKTDKVIFDPLVYTGGNKATLTVRRKSDGKDIYRFILEENDNKWTIDDVICIP